MEPDQKPRRTSELTTWIILVGVFVAAIAVTVVIGSRGGSSSDTTFPDLGDLTAADPNVPAIDETAPTFSLQTLDGEVFDLAAHVASDDRPVFLNLWASWCAPCRAEMPAINTAAQRHPEVLFVGVAVKDDAESATAFVEEIGVTYTIAID
ncbi:MAG: TlpA disulfide reductase family protein, partial [Acidimicrobiia bacterium]|nr:TlpA disulfide reductase family protein [Acidimicrobiia bacterium]MDX2467755.1 TlpA disulfide reductase family protein [Acidimicrobiia bacterium]